jgi:hypothetical protein
MTHNHLGRYFEIRLFRNPEVVDAHTDDKIHIHPSEEDDSYEILFRDADSRVKYNFTLDCEGLETYLEGFFSMLPIDKDPYRAVQFTLPGFPSLLFSIDDLKKDSIKKCVKQLIHILIEVQASSY